MEFIDLRSDTVTHPTDEMREAMANADVGDDVFGEDPTINKLQEMAASQMGKEAGLFVTSGTMGNLIAVMAVCNRGDEVILGNLAHTFLFEVGGISALGGVHPYVLNNQTDGTLKMDDIKNAIRKVDVHFPTTRQIILENTHNRCGGVPLTVEYTQQVAQMAKDQGISLHLDGARVFHAATSLKVDVRKLVDPVDLVTFCLSKGLCAPVGSVLCGSKHFIDKARRIRKQLGGGMRQAGVLAAAGIVALEKMSTRLEEDHKRAAKLAEGLRKLPGLSLDTNSPYTNMIFANLADGVKKSAADVARQLLEYKVKVGVVGDRRFRLVVHYWINDKSVDDVLNAFSNVFAG